ncbi:thiamine phosphate synthase [Winogradskyella vidalii]|uniref:thiamine phosphate synthase n=1 Tax=Winogradskyella vidalii TaxID=2615024 RepID=UPI001C54A092|nr:thiamine phosphate synthase [Winogradskyella vidalii]
MSPHTQPIASGIYLVIDPAMAEPILLEKLQVILTRNIAAVQIWDNFDEVANKLALIKKIHTLCAAKQVPVLINNQWEILKTVALEGVHFDKTPLNIDVIRKEITPNALMGLTCGNDLDVVHWAAHHQMDYISFCSMFPSSSADNCEIISHETIKKAAQIFKQPLFLAGGIHPENIKALKTLDFDGIAVISGIMNAEHPDEAIDTYTNHLKTIA